MYSFYIAFENNFFNEKFDMKFRKSETVKIFFIKNSIFQSRKIIYINFKKHLW